MMPAVRGQRSLSIRSANLVMLISLAAYIGFSRASASSAFLMGHTLLRICLGEVCLAAPGLITLLIRKVDIPAFIQVYEPDAFSLKMAFSALLCTYPIVIVINLISIKYVHNSVSDVMPSVMSSGYLPALLVMALLPALAEEFIFRGIMFHAYRQSSVPGAVFMSALLFGLMHLNLNQMPYAFFLGIILAIMVQVTGSIVTSMFMHFIFNGVSVTLSFFSSVFSSGNAADAEESSQAAAQLTENLFGLQSVIMMICVIGIMMFLLILIVRKTVKHTGIGLTAKGEGRILDIWIIIFIIITAWLTLRNTVFV